MFLLYDNDALLHFLSSTPFILSSDSFSLLFWQRQRRQPAFPFGSGPTLPSSSSSGNDNGGSRVSVELVGASHFFCVCFQFI
ncbi:hypothetical protein SDJN03_06934, partial [Cucurbita argyrosperma subsp. sororia]